jgi:uncharacterized protein (DUF58 family)
MTARWLPDWLRPAPAAAAAAPTPAAPDHHDPQWLLRHLEWTVIRRLDGALQGDWRTLLRGQGIDLADLREYQHHDDVRHIDWNVTARLQQPHVRVYTEDREMTAWFLVDCSASMDFGSAHTRKRETATAFVAVMARLLTRHGNRVGALLHDGSADRAIAAGGGRGQVLRLLHALVPPAGPRPAAPTQLHTWLGRAGHALERRSALFVVSDFISAPGWEGPLGQLARRHDVVAIRVVDPLDRQLPPLGLLPLRDAETGEVQLVDTRDPGFRRRLAALTERREQALQAAFSHAGVDVLELSTTESLPQALLRFADLRRHRQRVGALWPAHLRRSA